MPKFQCFNPQGLSSEQQLKIRFNNLKAEFGLGTLLIAMQDYIEEQTAVARLAKPKVEEDLYDPSSVG